MTERSSQRYGIDYEETCSPVVRHVSLRFMMQCIHARSTDEINLEQPQRFIDASRVCKLHRAINGLQQSGRVWNIKLLKALKRLDQSNRWRIPACLIQLSYNYFWLIGWITFSKWSTSKMIYMGEVKYLVDIESFTHLNQMACRWTSQRSPTSIWNGELCKTVSTPSELGKNYRWKHYTRRM